MGDRERGSAGGKTKVSDFFERAADGWGARASRVRGTAWSGSRARGAYAGGRVIALHFEPASGSGGMNGSGASHGRILYQLARADFLERVRRYSFLFTMGISLYLGYAAATGRLVKRVNDSRGVFNSAWIGGAVALGFTTFLTLAGVFVVEKQDEGAR